MVDVSACDWIARFAAASAILVPTVTRSNEEVREFVGFCDEHMAVPSIFRAARQELL
ncbi:MAG: hypothetical protein ACRDV0_00910 [Acidimicrobiales bacterium]